MTIAIHRFGVALALSLSALPFLTGRAQAPKNDNFVGKVMPVAEVRAKLAKDTNATHVLVGEDGKLYPLVNDAGARMFAKDKRLLNRPMRLTGRLDPKSSMLQVINVHSLKNGKLHEVYYWCDICTIKAFQNTICECCGAPMELREVPVK